MTLSRAFVAIILLSLMLLFLSLGSWQLGRAEEKKALVNAGQQTVEPEAISPDTIWLATTLVGSYLAEAPVLLDNQSYKSKPGYQVFSRFKLESQQQILVNRGWVAKDETPLAPPSGETRVSGIVAPYRKAGMRLGPPVVSLPEQQPVVVNYPTQQEWEQLFQQPLLPITLWLAPDQPHGFIRDWQLQSSPPEKHLGYAFQWFAMATAVAVISLILLVRVFRSHD